MVWLIMLYILPVCIWIMYIEGGIAWFTIRSRKVKIPIGLFVFIPILNLIVLYKFLRVVFKL